MDIAYGRRTTGASKLLYILAKVGRPLTRHLNALQACGEVLPQYGHAVKEATGVSVIEQFVQQYEGATRYHLPPEDYYLYSVYNDASRIGQYISQAHWWRLLQSLLRAQETDEGELLDDKSRGEAHFLKHGLPTIQSLAEIRNGHIHPREWGGQSPLPACDLFSKPVNASFGKGARRWRIRPDGQYRTEDGALVSQQELLDQLKRQSEQRPVLLQLRVANHDRLRTLCGDALVSLRIVTMRPPDAQARYIIGCISLPLGDVIGSNSRFSVLPAPIDENTGRLGAAFNRKDLAKIMEPVPVHPLTDERIEGFQLPHWDQAVALALEAHETLPTIALVGWDIALTSAGPVIIEGNSTPGPNSPQIAHKMPWGATDFPELYIANWEHATSSGHERAA